MHRPYSISPTDLSFVLICLLLAGCGGTEPGATSGSGRSPWVAQYLATDAEFRDVFFLDNQRGWMVGGGHDIHGGIVGRTRDGGLTWEYRSGVARPSPQVRLFHLNAIRFVDEDTGIIAGDRGQILRTVDGGEHWHRVQPERRASADLLDMNFVDGRHGWAVGGKVLFRTTDGGATWDSPRSDDDESGFDARAIHFLDWQEGWALGRHGRVFHTTDGGETWSRRFDPDGSAHPVMTSLIFVDRDLGWAVGERGAIRHTSDGGFSWRHQPGGKKAYLTDVHFADARHGWIVGYRRADGTSLVLHTGDGGVTWTEQARVHGEELQAVFFNRAGYGWTVGDRVRPEAQKLLRYEPGP